jgi:uncharacterized repeat protein (TIGR01451 family)
MIKYIGNLVARACGEKIHQSMEIMQRLVAVFVIAAIGALSSFPAHASYTQRYYTIQKGGVSFTGNTLGLDGNTGTSPGTNGTIGAFIQDGGATAVTTFPIGTTSNYLQNKSAAQLSLPSGSTVLYAELVWSGSIAGLSGAQINSSVTFTTPSGSYTIAPDGATAGQTANFYTRSANVTAYVQAAGGTGVYKVGGVAASVATGSTTDAAGWTLAVAYANPNSAPRNLTIFVGYEQSGSAAAAVTGFCTPVAGPVSARLAVSAIEGDSSIAGDQMQFGATTGTLTPVSGPNNLVGNFFSSQINNNNGTLDTSSSATFSSRNSVPGTDTAASRQGYDITNIDVSSSMTNSQTTAFAQGTTTGDVYAINALGIQVDVTAPKFPVTVLSVNRTTTYIGDRYTYSVNLDNTTGNGAANNVVFYNTLPPGLSFVANSVTINGAASAGSDPGAGVVVGNVGIGSVVTVAFQVDVVSLPSSPSAAQFTDQARWTYNFVACAGALTQSGSVLTNPVTVPAFRLEPTKTVSPTGGVSIGQTLSYTIGVPNTGTTPTSNSTLGDPIPAGTAYVTGSTRMNGVVVGDSAGAMPFAVVLPINSPGSASGVIASGAAATVQYSVTVTTAGIITNTASADPDGAGPAAPFVVSVVSTSLSAPVVTMVFSPASVGAGTLSTLTITLGNANAVAITGVGFNDSLPSDLLAASPSSIATTCGGATSITSGNGGFTLSGGSIPANGSCIVSLSVFSNIAATYVDSIGANTVVSNNAQANIAASATLTVTPPPTIGKSFSPSSVAPGTSTSLVVTLGNPTTVPMTGATFTDTFPTSPGAMTLFNTVTSNTCGGAITTAADGALAAGSTSIKLTGATIPASGVCKVTFNVKVAVGGAYINTIPAGSLTSSGGASQVDASANMQGIAPDFAKIFTPSSTSAGTTVTMTVTITNTSSVALTGLGFADSYPSGLINKAGTATNTCGGTVTASANNAVVGFLNFANGTLAAGSSCTIVRSVSASPTGTYVNTIPAGTTTSSIGPGLSSPTATLNAGLPTVIPAFAVPYIAPGGVTTVTYTLANPTAANMTGVTLTDTLPSGLTATGTTGGTCAGTKTAGGSSVSLTGSTIPLNASCTLIITVTSSVQGLKTVTASPGELTTTVPAGGSNLNTDSTTLNVLTPPAISIDFAPMAIIPSGTSTLRYILSNPNSIDLTGVTFTNAFPTTPAQMQMASPLSVTSSCSGSIQNNVGGALTTTSVGIRLTGGIIPSNGSCEIDITVTAPASGSYVNTIPLGGLTNTQGVANSVATSATLTAQASSPMLVKSFAPTSIVAGAISTLSITITNPSGNAVAITGLQLTDVFPSAMKVAATPNLINGCGFTLTSGTAANDSSIIVTNGTVPVNSTCKLVVDVTSSALGVSTNTTGQATSSNAATSTTTSATLTVTPTKPTIAIAFSPATIATGGTSVLTFSIGNANASALSNAKFTDTLSNMFTSSTIIGGTCYGVTNTPALANGATALSLTIPSLPAGGCTISINVNSTTVGSNSNTTSGVSTTETPSAGAVSNTAVLTVTAGANLAGTVYSDANHNGQRDGSENGTGLTLYAKAIPTGSPAGPAVQSAVVDPVTGAFAFSSVPAGQYTIIIDDNATLSDVIPTIPSTWIGTETPDQTRRNVVIASTDLSVINFGLFNGNQVTGRVFNDNGASGGTANNGILDGGETGIGAVTIKVTDATGATVYDTTKTDGGGAYILFISAATSGSLRIAEVNTSGLLSTGGSGPAAMTYSRVTDMFTFNYVAGINYAGVNFGDVPVTTLVSEGLQTGVPGGVLFFQHTLIAGSAGSITISTASASGWQRIVIRDTNCNGNVDTGELPVTAPISVFAGDKICLVVKVSIPAGTGLRVSDQTTLTAVQSYTGSSPALSVTLANTDTASTGTATSAALFLQKSLDNGTPLPGTVINYTIAYSNHGSDALSTIKINDAAPAFTTFVSAACVLPLPAGITSCMVTTSPSVGATGQIEWTLGGSLYSGATGQVVFAIKVNP